MEEGIQFISTLKDFVCIKKLKVDEEVTKEDIIEFLAAVQVSTDLKIKDYLEKIIDSKKLLDSIKEMFSKDYSIFFTEVNSSKVKKIITELLPQTMGKDMKDAFIDAYKVYLIEKYCLQNKMVLSYHQIIFPSRKKQLKKALKA